MHAAAKTPHWESDEAGRARTMNQAITRTTAATAIVMVVEGSRPSRHSSATGGIVFRHARGDRAAAFAQKAGEVVDRLSSKGSPARQARNPSPAKLSTAAVPIAQTPATRVWRPEEKRERNSTTIGLMATDSR